MNKNFLVVLWLAVATVFSLAILGIFESIVAFNCWWNHLPFYPLHSFHGNGTIMLLAISFPLLTACALLWLAIIKFSPRVDFGFYGLAAICLVLDSLISIQLQSQNFTVFRIYFFGAMLLGMIATLGLSTYVLVKKYQKQISTAVSQFNLRLRTNSLSIEKKKELPTSEYSITNLLEAIISKNITLVRSALVEHPEQLNTAYAQNGNTPLHVAALNGYTEIVRLLLEQPGIDTTRTNSEGKTALDLAREKEFKEIVKLLGNKQL